MASQPISGRTLGHYRLLERIGEGGMGVVYRARDEHLQREVALKVLPPRVIDNESARRRFKKEALILARLNHPNVAILHDFETDDGVDFLVMEYVRGATLASKLSTGPQRESELLGNAVQLVSALEEAHKQGVIHRDLKPANILLTASGQLKILDFGLARFLSAEGQSDTATDTLTVAGTLPYVAPEHVSGSKEPDSRSDVYSCGAVLYEMATGRRAHNETSVPAMLAAILNREPPPVRSLNPAISPELEAIIRKAMDKEPALRYQTASELKVDLQRLVSGKKLEIVPARRRPSHSPGLTRVLAILLFLLIALEVATLKWKARGPRTPAKATPRVVAVLPFDAVGGNRDNQVLCRGLTDLLTARLTQISKQYDVEVVPASEVRNQGVSSVGAARNKLGVSLVVEGSWDFAGKQVMYSLVNAESRRSINAESFTADVRDLFSVERQVSDGLLKMVVGELRPESGTGLASTPAAQPDAYQYYVRGIGYLREYQDLSSLQSAVGLFRTALERDPSFALALAGAGEAYWRLYQETKDETWIPKALDACRRAEELNTNLAPVHTTLGLIYQGQSKYDAAVKEFERALSLDPTSDGAYRGLASSYESLGKNSEAEAAYKRAIAARKDYWAGYSWLGAFYAKNGKYDEAAAQLRRVIEMAPENVRGYSNLAGVLLLQGKLQEAEELLRKSISIEPNYRGYSNLGSMLFSQEKYSDSARMYEKAIELNESDARVWGNLGDAYYWAPGERNKADRAYKRAIQLVEGQRKVNPNDPTLIFELALWKSMSGDQAEAVKLIKEVLARSSTDSDVMFRAAEIFEHGGDHAAALTWLARAVRTGHSIAEIRQDPTFQGLRENPEYKQLIEAGSKGSTSK